jgi:hypothetical protein
VIIRLFASIHPVKIQFGQTIGFLLILLTLMCFVLLSGFTIKIAPCLLLCVCLFVCVSLFLSLWCFLWVIYMRIFTYVFIYIHIHTNKRIYVIYIWIRERESSKERPPPGSLRSLFPSRWGGKLVLWKSRDFEAHERPLLVNLKIQWGV